MYKDDFSTDKLLTGITTKARKGQGWGEEDKRGMLFHFSVYILCTIFLP